MKWVSAGFVFILTSCAPATESIAPRPLAVPADSAEYARYSAGTHQLEGQAFLTTRGGDVKVAAGRTVTLDPATRYAREWFRRFGATSLESTSGLDPLFIGARRTTVADAEGRFRFSGLTAGDYIVRTQVTWETGAAYTPAQGGIVGKLVTLPRDGGSPLVLNEMLTRDLAAALGVEIVDGAALAARPHRVVQAAVEGTDCQSAALAPRPTEGAARADLVVNAARLGADAVGNVVCTTHGLNLRRNCVAWIQCIGDAVAWT